MSTRFNHKNFHVLLKKEIYRWRSRTAGFLLLLLLCGVGFFFNEEGLYSIKVVYGSGFALLLLIAWRLLLRRAITIEAAFDKASMSILSTIQMGSGMALIENHAIKTKRNFKAGQLFDGMFWLLIMSLFVLPTIVPEIFPSLNNYRSPLPLIITGVVCAIPLARIIRGWFYASCDHHSNWTSLAAFKLGFESMEMRKKEEIVSEIERYLKSELGSKFDEVNESINMMRDAISNPSSTSFNNAIFAVDLLFSELRNANKMDLIKGNEALEAYATLKQAILTEESSQGEEREKEIRELSLKMGFEYFMTAPEDLLSHIETLSEVPHGKYGNQHVLRKMKDDVTEYIICDANVTPTGADSAIFATFYVFADSTLKFPTFKLNKSGLFGVSKSLKIPGDSLFSKKFQLAHFNYFAKDMGDRPAALALFDDDLQEQCLEPEFFESVEALKGVVCFYSVINADAKDIEEKYYPQAKRFFETLRRKIR